MTLDTIKGATVAKASEPTADFAKLTPLERRNAVAVDSYRIRQVLLRNREYEPYTSPVDKGANTGLRHLSAVEKHIADESTIDLLGLIISCMNDATKAARGEASAIPASGQRSIDPRELLPVSRSVLVKAIAQAELDQHGAWEIVIDEADRKKLLGNGANRWRSILTTVKATGMLDALVFYGAIEALPAIRGAHHLVVLSNPLGVRIADFLLGRASNPDPDLPADKE